MLSDKDKRARYDQFGHAGVDPNYGAGGGAGAGGFGGFGDMGDIFDSISVDLAEASVADVLLTLTHQDVARI